MTAAGLHELTALRQRLVRMRASHAAQGDQLDDLFDLVSRMEDTALNRDDLSAVDELGIGCFVKVTDEWFTYMGMDGHGRMVLHPREGTRGPCFYEPTAGERFMSEEPF